MPDPVTLATSDLIKIAVGSGGVAALFLKGVDLLHSGWLRRLGEKREMALSARTIAEHLEIYAFGCAGHMFSTWEVLERDGAGAMITNIPEFPAFAKRINWQVLDLELAAAASSLRNRVEVARGAIESSFSLGAAQGHFYAYAQAAMIGADAFRIAAGLRRKAGPAQESTPAYAWDFATFLNGEHEKQKVRYKQIFAWAQGEPLTQEQAQAQLEAEETAARDAAAP